MGRKHRIQQNEYAYHVTTRTNGRCFTLKKKANKIIGPILEEACIRYKTCVSHFKLMDNHYHMSISTPDANISEVMWFINNRIAKKMNWSLGTTGHFWGARFHSTIIDDEKYALRCMRYIYTNGVRAGLCRRASEDKKYGTFSYYAYGRMIDFSVTSDPIFMALGRRWATRRKEFRELMDLPLTDEELSSIRRGLRRRFYGSAEFMSKMKAKYG